MRKHSVTFLWIAVVVALVAPSASAQTYRNIYHLGQPATRFSAQPADTLPELQRQFVAYRGDLEQVLNLAGWSGDSDALFRTVADAQSGGATVTAKAISTGDTFHWMAYRKDGKPAIQRNVRWAGSEPFAAWQIQFVSDGAVHTFVVPHTCLNLAYYGQPIPVDAPGAPKVPGVPGAAPMTPPTPAAPPAAAPSTPAAAPATAAPESSAPATGAPSGTAPMPTPTPTPAPMTPAAAPASPAPMHDAMAPSDREGRWTIRGWGARVDPTDDKWRGEWLGIGEASQFSLTRGVGVGADAEYQMNRRWGVDFGLMAGVPLEMHWMFDTSALWEMDTADMDLMAAFVGLNYHFLPDKRIDVFAGPFVSLYEFGSTSLETAMGFDTKVDPDGEFALGAVVGVDIPFSADSPWIATGAVRYTPLSIEDSPVKFDVDPMIFSLGIGYRF